MVYMTKDKIPLGDIYLASDGVNLVGLWFEGQKYFGYGIDKDVVFKDDLVIFAKTKLWLERYFKGDKPKIKELPLAFMKSSDFQKLVWLELINIPYGEVISYKELAMRIARTMGRETMSPQAIGNAVSHNPISIIVPCHRVVGKHGEITGYASGIENKIKLLELEKVNLKEMKEV